MKFMYNKSKYTIVFLLIFSLFMQISGPIVQSYVYAEDVIEAEQDNLEQKDSPVDTEIPEGGEESEEPQKPDQESENQLMPDESIEKENPSVDTDESTEENQSEDDNVESGKTDEEEQENQEEPDKDSDNKEAIEDPVDKEEKSELEPEPEPEEKQTIEDEKEPFIGPMIEEEIKLYSAPKDLGNIFTSVELEINDVEANPNQVVKIEDGTKVNLNYTWDTKGLDAKAGDYSEIDVPDTFKLDRDFEDEDIIVDGVNIGTYSIISNKLKFKFNENIEKGNVKNGVLGFGVKFNEEKFTEDVVEEIEFKDKRNKSITIIGEPTNTVIEINKKGIPDSDKDAKKITWTVDITNPSNTEIKGASLTDVLPAGLKIETDNIVVNDLNIKLDGSLNKGAEVSNTPTIDGQNIEFKFDIDPYKGYRVKYTTKIEDYSKAEFTNNAIFDNGNDQLPAKATVDIKRSGGIEKDGKYLGYNKDKRYDEIEWKIDVNKSGGSINEAIVEDKLPIGTILVPDSIEIVKLTKETNDKWTESPSNKTSSEFPVNLGKLEGDAYRIKFKTSIDYTEVEDGAYQKVNSFKNETTLNDGENNPIGDADKTVTVTRKPILQKTGFSNVNYNNKIITWTIIVNEANHKINNAVIKDTLPAGLTITESNIEVKDSSGKVVTDKFTITVPDNDGTNPTEIKIDLGDINEKYIIEYTTKITDFTVNKFENGVSLEGTGVGEGGKIPVVPVNPPKNSYGKSFSSIDYDKKTMDWKIAVNPTRESIKTLTITDTFPNKGLILLNDKENPLIVKVGKKTLTEGTDYTLTENTEGNRTGYEKGFIIEFKESENALPINNKITITYTTSYDPEKGIDANTADGLYENKAHFKGTTENDNNIDVNQNAQKQVNKSTINTGKKIGKLISVDEEGKTVDGWYSGNERKIQWEVYINYLEQNLGTGVTVLDELDYEGKIDKDSIEVREYTVDSGGNTNINANEISAFNLSLIRILKSMSEDNYTIKMTEKNKGFVLNFNEDFEVNKRYVIIFTTSVPDISKKVYTNNAYTKVGNKEYSYTGSIGYDKYDNNLSKKALVDGDKVYTDDEINWNIKINEGLSVIQKDVKVIDTISSGLVYKKGSLNVYRLQGTEKIKVDPKSEKGYTLDVASNDQDETVLTIKFKDSISSTYEIEYITVVTETDGKVNNSVEYSGINLEKKTKTTKKLNAEQFSYVGGEWDPAKGLIKIEKQNINGETITSSEAKFALYYELNGERIKFANKDFETKDGKLEIGNLSLNRTYYLEEIEAPEGYIIADEENPREITILDEDGENEIKLEFVNSKKIQVTGKKIWIDGPEVKPDIKLQLYRDGEAYGESVTLEDGTTEYTWTDLAKTDTDGEEYIYTIDEEEVEKDSLKNYGKSYSDDKLTITNTYNSPKTDVVARKIWENGPTPRPDIKLQLYRDGVAYGEPVTLQNGETEYIWKDLDRTDKNAKSYTYTIKEVNVPENYEKSEEGLIVTNTYIIPKTQVTGIKKWVNGSAQKPSIELQLYRDDKAYGEPVTLEDGETIYTWTDLDKTDINGKVYIYTVDEVSVPYRYDKEISADGLTITNIYNPPSDSGGSDPDNKTGRLKILKKAYDTNDLLEGAEFDIINSKGKVVDTLITDRKGRAVSKDLPLGDYEIKEVKAPEGYILNDRVVEKTIRYGVSQEVVVYNELDEPEDPDNPKNPEDPENPEDLEDPEDPENPKDPENPDKPGDSDKPKDPDEETDIDGSNPEGRPDLDPENPNKPKDPDEETNLDGDLPKDRPSLPVTGSKDNIALYAIGLVSIIIGIVLRKKTKQEIK